MNLLLHHIPNQIIHHEINTFRIYLQIITVSDMVDILGKKILPNILQVLNNRKSKLHWPKMEVPLEYWRKWSAYLTTVIKQ